MEKNVSIENYKPDFAVEAAYDLTVTDLKKQGIKAVLVDLDNTLIAWNNPDGTPEMRPWVGLWNTWCFWAQFAGAVAISGQRPLRVAGAYVVYWLVSSLLLFVFLLMFVSSGWLDANELNANVVKMLEAMQQAR